MMTPNDLDVPVQPDWLAHDNHNWLALLLCGLHENESRRPPLPATDDPTLDDKLFKRYGPALDTIARLLVYKNQQQVVSVAFKFATFADPPTVIVAQSNEVDPKVKKGLDSLLSHLRHIRTLYVARYGPYSSPDEGAAVNQLDPEDPLRTSCITGELHALHYCWKKNQARFTKHGRYKTFLKLIADVEGDPANQRRDISDPAELQTLTGLQALSAADQKRLRDVRSHIESIRDLILDKTMVGTDAPTVDDLETLVFVRARLHFLVKLLDGSSKLWSLCTNYLRARHQARVHSAEQAQPLLDRIDDAEQPFPSPFDVGKWLKKIVSVSWDYAQLLRIIRSPTMASVLFEDRPIAIYVLRNLAPSQGPAEISLSAIRAALHKAGWADIEDEQYNAFVNDLHNTLKAYITTAATLDGESSSGSTSALKKKDPLIHCECALLAHLHNSGGVAECIPYIGVSKLSCWLCSVFFECYRTVTGSRVRTQGTHGQLVPWQAPVISPGTTIDTDIRQILCEKLLAKLKTEAQVVRAHRRNASTSTQSTIASQPKSSEYDNEDPSQDHSMRRVYAAVMKAALAK